MDAYHTVSPVHDLNTGTTLVCVKNIGMQSSIAL